MTTKSCCWINIINNYWMKREPEINAMFYSSANRFCRKTKKKHIPKFPLWHLLFISLQNRLEIRIVLEKHFLINVFSPAHPIEHWIIQILMSERADKLSRDYASDYNRRQTHGDCCFIIVAAVVMLLYNYTIHSWEFFDHKHKIEMIECDFSLKDIKI